MSSFKQGLHTVWLKTFGDRRLVRRARSVAFYAANMVEGCLRPGSIVKARQSVSSITAHFDQLASTLEDAGHRDEIPRIIHFVYGMKQAEEMPYYALVAVKSAQHFNPGWRVFFHYHHEPTGSHWEEMKRWVTPSPIPDFQYYGRAKLNHYAHKADIVRLLALKHIGGAYLDIDTLTARSFETLVRNEFVMGVQASILDKRGGLCNAVMLSARGSIFVRRWLGCYTYFRSKGYDQWWDNHSVKLPALLAYRYPREIAVLDHDAFFYPLWVDLERILLRESSSKWLPKLTDAFVFHLWNTYTEKELSKIDAQFLKESSSAYAAIAKKAFGL